VRVGFADFALGVDEVDWKVAGPVEVEIRIEVFAEELVERLGVLRGDMAIADVLANHRPVLGFNQPIVVAVAGPRLGLLHQ